MHKTFFSAQEQIIHQTYPTSQNIIPPSEPPLANILSWMGCQATAKTKTIKI